MSPMSKGRLRRGAAAGCAALLVASLSSGCFAEPSVLPTVRDFLIAWQVGNYKAAAKHTTGERAQVAKALQDVPKQLDAVSLKFAMGKIVKSGEQADVRFVVKVDLGENGDQWEYPGQMHLRRIKGDWKIDWSPSVIHPNLKPGSRLAILNESPARASIQDATGNSLLRTVPVVIVGVLPGDFADESALRRTLSALAADTRLDAERLIGRVRSAPPRQFLPLVTLAQPEHAKLTAKLRRVPGLRFQETKAPIEPAYAAELVGELGPATAERLQQVGAPYQPGDTIGASGLQLIYQRRLAGTPTVKAVAVDAAGTVEVLREWPGQPGELVRTTLGVRDQKKAEDALRGLQLPATLVAVHQATGQVLAVADHLTGGREIGLSGSYMPGMAFSLVSAEALLANGYTVRSRTDCPPTTAVGDQTITNTGPGKGPATLATNFAYACPTAFALLSRSLNRDALMKEINRFGLGKNFGQPVPMFSGSVPTPANDAEQALTVTGQGSVRVSPLSMALIAGAAASGTWRPPQLFNKPEIVQPIQPQPLEPVPVRDLRTLLRQAVNKGVAKKANVANNVNGVASTVTYTEGGAQKTVSWFVGFRGDIACAILIEGKVDAAAVAARFLVQYGGKG